jgi:phosphatidylglycerophosphate synthase
VVRTQHAAPAGGFLGVCALLGVLQALVGLGAQGWAVGLGCGSVLGAALAAGMRRFGRSRLGPADLVTLSRGVLACGVAALVADSLVRPAAVGVLVALASVALLLDAVDGRVARWTRSSTPFGGRFDGEVDAFLIAVLSVHVASSYGWEVLAIGGVRYVFGAVGWLLPWMRGELLPFRYWRKVVTATVGIVLVVTVADLLPRVVGVLGLTIAAALLAETFGRDVRGLWRHRPGHAPAHRRGPAPAPEPRRRVVPALVTLLAALVVWVPLVAPHRAYGMHLTDLLRIPLEALVLGALALAVPARARWGLAVPVGLGLLLVTLLTLLDIGFSAAFDRPFDLVNDRGYLGPGITVLSDSVGRTAAIGVVVGVGVLLVALVVGMPWAVARVAGVLARHRRRSRNALAGLTVAYAVCAALGLQVAQGEPVASLAAGRLAVDHVRAVGRDADEQKRFDAAVRTDRFRATPGDDLLQGLHGKNVLVVFVESYGRVALEGSEDARWLQAWLDDEDRRLGRRGFSAASAYLTSSTFGGLSWLAHGSLQSGLWVDNQRRYDQLLSGNRLTLSRAFGQAGWRTVAFVPSGGDPWPEGKRFYRLDRVYGRWDVGYAGPRFGFSKMPDQFALEAVHRLELHRATSRRPVMAEIDLASSHEPWAKIPRMVPWATLGDGSRFGPMADEVEVPVRELWADTDAVKAAYARSIRYSLRALYSFVERYGDKDTVLVVLGDHQPGTAVSGHRASRDVPVTLLTGDPAVTRRIAGWGWHRGLRPRGRAPVWRMDAFRDRFFDAFAAPRPRPGDAPQ